MSLQFMRFFLRKGPNTVLVLVTSCMYNKYVLT